jgi:hypothetical protein
MPYADPDKQREAVREGVAKHRKTQKEKLNKLTNILEQIEQIQKEKNQIAKTVPSGPSNTKGLHDSSRSQEKQKIGE